MIDLEHATLHAGAFTLRDVSLHVPAGSHTALMGRTGAGKTSLLEALCGLRQLSAGRLLINHRDVTHAPPAARGIGLVPQDAALFPHLTVREHLAFALVVRRWDPDRQARRVAELAEALGLAPLLDRLPAGLSGGETQRVALGRALAFQPDVLCLDEPLSALDDESRTEIGDLLARLRRDSRLTILHITHHRPEAERLADRILQLRHGRIETDFPNAAPAA